MDGPDYTGPQRLERIKAAAREGMADDKVWVRASDLLDMDRELAHYRAARLEHTYGTAESLVVANQRLRGRLHEAEYAVEAVRALHRPWRDTNQEDEWATYCAECCASGGEGRTQECVNHHMPQQCYPCRTLRALDGDPVG